MLNSTLRTNLKNKIKNYFYKNFLKKSLNVPQGLKAIKIIKDLVIEYE